MFKKIMTLLALCCFGMLEFNVEAFESEETLPKIMKGTMPPGFCPGNPFCHRNHEGYDNPEDFYKETLKKPMPHICLGGMHTGKTSLLVAVRNCVVGDNRQAFSFRLLAKGQTDVTIPSDRTKAIEFDGTPVSYGRLTEQLTKSLVGPNIYLLIDEIQFGELKDIESAIQLETVANL